jgi:hypothetical protein
MWEREGWRGEEKTETERVEGRQNEWEEEGGVGERI